jgi:hypothetical protein
MSGPACRLAAAVIDEGRAQNTIHPGETLRLRSFLGAAQDLEVEGLHDVLGVGAVTEPAGRIANELALVRRKQRDQPAWIVWHLRALGRRGAVQGFVVAVHGGISDIVTFDRLSQGDFSKDSLARLDPAEMGR